MSTEILAPMPGTIFQVHVKEGDDVTGKLATKERELVYTKKLDNNLTK